VPLKAWLKKAWPHLRAALVLFHLTAIVVLAFPAPVGGLDRSAWKVATVQRDLEAWAHTLHVSEPAFEDFLYAATTRFMAVRNVAVKPFNPYVDWTGCEQPWRMFVGPVRYPSRLQVQVRHQGAPPDAWETLFEERSPEHRWRESIFAPDRLRSQIARWSWPQFAWAYDAGCAWIARMAFDDDPGVTDVRCRFFRRQSPTPDQVSSHTEPQGSYADVREHHRPAPAAPRAAQ
jgi:hypothetical protein